MKIVVVAILMVGCTGRVTLEDAYRQTSDVTCDLELQCTERTYIAEYGAPTESGHERCVANLTSATLGQRDPNGDVNLDMLDACTETLKALTCDAFIAQGQWPSSCVRIPK